MRTCREVTELVSASLDRDLPLTGRLGVRLHLLMCKPCALYERQLRSLSRILNIGASPEHGPDLPPDSAQRLQQAIDDETHAS